MVIDLRRPGPTIESIAVTMKNGVFWDVTPCGSCKNRRFGGTNQTYPSTEVWDFALYSGHLQPHTTIPFPPLPSASTILNSILASFLTWYFFAACVGC
jgi:hypothetical protein